MTTHDFIFSSKRHYIAARHIAFWATWSVAYLLFVHYPVHAFKGWSFNPAVNPNSFANLEKLGLAMFVLKTLLFNTLMAAVISQMLFVYSILYCFLPKFVYQKRNNVIAVLVLLLIFLVYYFSAALSKFFVPVGNYVFGLNAKLELDNPLTNCIYSATRDLITSLPIVAGFAIMIKQIKNWWLKQSQTIQLANEAAKAELQLLKAQVHPHFLFNTLNNIYYFALNGSPKAPEMIKKLSGLLQYILTECKQQVVSLQKELNMIEDYVALEKIRYGERIQMNISIEGECAGKFISPLLLIPFVENAFKHGASKMIAHPWLALHVMVTGNHLFLTISNSRPSQIESSYQKGNIGLKNVQKRLQLLYAGAHELKIIPEPDRFTIHLQLQLAERIDSGFYVEEITSNHHYAVA